MRLIKQQGMVDCGIACAAMICQTRYRDADWAFNDRNRDRGLTTRHMIDGIRLLGPMFPNKERLQKWNYDAAVRLISDNDVALLKVIDTTSIRKDFHWCVFDPERGHILDPLGEVIKSWQITHNWMKVTHYIAFR